MLRVGLTGGIASGKSSVLERLAAAGFVSLDLDRVAHDVMAPGGAAHAAVLAAFGPAVRAADGSIDRKRLGPIVFGNPGARERLNAIVHPCVRDEEARRLAAIPERAGSVSVSDAALLVESGAHLRYDRLVVVWCSPEEQLRRLRNRDGLSEAAARERIAAQMPPEEKRRFAHFEIDTEGGFEETVARAQLLAGELDHLARMPSARAILTRERSESILANNPTAGPRGLDAQRLLERLSGEEHLEMNLLAALLDPAAQGPWYQAALPAAEEAPGPEILAAPLAFFCAARRGRDRDFLAAAAASLARLTHTAPQAIATAVLAAQVAADLLQGERGVEPSIAVAGAAAERWGGAAPDIGAVRSLAGRLVAANPRVAPELRRVVARFV